MDDRVPKFQWCCLPKLLGSNKKLGPGGVKVAKTSTGLAAAGVTVFLISHIPCALLIGGSGAGVSAAAHKLLHRNPPNDPICGSPIPSPAEKIYRPEDFIKALSAAHAATNALPQERTK